MQLLQRKQAQYAIGFAVWLSIVAVAVLVTWAPQRLILIADIVVLVALVILCEGGGSIYKLALWFRYRKEPDKRELIASGQMFPQRLRKFLMDEPDERKGGTHNEETPSRRRKTDSRRETGRSC